MVGAVLGCSYGQAKLLVRQYSASDPSTLDEALAALTAISDAPTADKPMFEEVPDSREIKPTGTTAKFWNYLQSRGFDDPQAVIDRYRLRGCLRGRYKDRLLIPFYRENMLIAWTARAIGNPKYAPRYLSSNLVKSTVFNEDGLAGGNTLFVVEGPFDALKIDFYGQKFGVSATCVFGTNISPDQVLILSDLRKLYGRVVILFDHDAIEPSFMALDWLQASNVEIGQLPDGTKDPGEMSRQEIETWLKGHWVR